MVWRRLLTVAALLASPLEGEGEPAGSLRVLCYGDSLTAGFHDGGRSFHPYAQRLSELCAPYAACDCVAAHDRTQAGRLHS